MASARSDKVAWAVGVALALVVMHTAHGDTPRGEGPAPPDADAGKQGSEPRRLAAHESGESTAPGERVAVFVVDACTPAALVGEATALARAASELPGVRVVMPGEVSKRLGGQAERTLVELERVVASTRFELVGPDGYTRATRILTSVVEDLARVPPSEARWSTERQARTLLALAHLKLGRVAEAQDMFLPVLRVDRAYVPDARLYPPSLRAFAEELRDQLARGPGSALTIATQPSGVSIYVDGRALGASPLTVQLPPGDYRVEADFAAARTVPRRIQLSGEPMTLTLEQAVEGAVHPDAGPCVDAGGGREARVAALSRLGLRVDVDTVMALRVEGAPSAERYLVASALDVRRGLEVREGRVRMAAGGVPDGTMPRLARFLVTGQAQGPVEPVALSVAPGNRAGVRREVHWPWLRTPAYVAAGVAGAAAVSAVLFHVQAQRAGASLFALGGSQTPPLYRTEDQTDVDTLKRVEAQRRTGFWISTGLAVTAAVAAGVGLWLSMPPGAPGVAVVPVPGGAALAGTF